MTNGLDALFYKVPSSLYFLDPKQEHHRRAVVPSHLRQQVLADHHRSAMGGHFAGKKIYGALVRHWWWDGMYKDILHFARNCQNVHAIVSGARW